MLVEFLRVDKRRGDFVNPSTFSDGDEIEVEVYGDISYSRPVFMLSLDAFNGFQPETFDYEYNYIHVSHWRRYYYIRDISYRGKMVTFSCEEDCLTSRYSALRDQSFYCTRSESAFDPSLTDTLYPTKAEPQTAARVALTPWQGVMDGSYILAINAGGDEPHIGVNSYYILNQSEMTQFLDDLMGSADLDFEGIGEAITKAIVNPMQYIRSCLWLPVQVDANLESVDSINFGWWSSSASAKVLDLSKNSDTYTQIAVTWDEAAELFKDDTYDYQSYPPYSDLTVTAYPFGVMQVPRTAVPVLKAGGSLQAALTLDHLTGMCECVLHTLTASGTDSGPLFLTTAQVGVEIPVGEVIQDFAGAVLHLGEAAGNLLSGNFLGAASGVYNALASVTPEVTVSGAEAGFAGLQLNENWYLRRVYYTQAQPVLSLCGLPCCQEKKLSELSGYAQFERVDVAGEMTVTEKEEITRLLEGGVYIE